MGFRKSVIIIGRRKYRRGGENMVRRSAREGEKYCGEKKTASGEVPGKGNYAAGRGESRVKKSGREEVRVRRNAGEGEKYRRGKKSG